MIEAVNVQLFMYVCGYVVVIRISSTMSQNIGMNIYLVKAKNQSNLIRFHSDRIKEANLWFWANVERVCANKAAFVAKSGLELRKWT